MPNSQKQELREKIAELIHEEWMVWAKSVESEVSLERRSRWRECYCPYMLLSEEDKNKDREYVDKIIEVLEK